MTRRTLRAVLVALVACQHEDTTKPVSNSTPTASASTTANASAIASSEAPPTRSPDETAGPLHEDTHLFGNATLTPLRVALSPSDQRKRDDKKSGPARIARVADSKLGGLATFGLATCDDSAGGRCTDQWFVRSRSARPLEHPLTPAVAFATYEARFAPDPHPLLLVLEDTSREPVATRFVGTTNGVNEVSLFDDRPAFFVRTFSGVVGVDDAVQFHAIAFVDGELRDVLSVYLGFHDAGSCPDPKRTKNVGPPGTVTIASHGAHPVLHVREAAADCDAPFKVLQGCAGTERDYAWDSTQKRFLAQGAGTKITLRATPTGC